MKRTYLAPKDDGGSEHVVNVDLGRSRAVKAPWDPLSTPGKPAPKRRGRPIGSQGKPIPTAPAPTAPEAPSSKLSLDPGASAKQFSKEDAESFWSSPSIPSVQPADISRAVDAMPLSGPAEEFDVATGWNFETVDLPEDLEPELDLSDEERAAPILPSKDELFSGAPPSWTRTSAPSAVAPVGRKAPPVGAAAPSSSPGARDLPEPGPIHRPAPRPPAPASHFDVNELLTQGREMLSSGDLAGAARALRQARRTAPDNNSVATWLEFAERRLMRDHVPNARPDSVPTLTQDRNALAAQATPRERQLIGALDGRRNLSALLAAGNDDAFVPMLKMLSVFEARGWITWA